MCKDCAAITPENEERMVTTSREFLKQTNALITEMLDWCNKAEDRYRTAGLIFHKTDKHVRDPEYIAFETLELLRNAFEIFSTKDYEYGFEDILKTQAELRTMLTQARTYGTPEEQQHRCCKLIEKLSVMGPQQHEQNMRVSYLIECAMELRGISRAYVDRSDSSVWYVNQGTADEPSPYYMDEEWEMFKWWVKCLPETKKAIETGRTLENVALTMLYAPEDGDGFTDERPRRGTASASAVPGASLFQASRSAAGAAGAAPEDGNGSTHGPPRGLFGYAGASLGAIAGPSQESRHRFPARLRRFDPPRAVPLGSILGGVANMAATRPAEDRTDTIGFSRTFQRLLGARNAGERPAGWVEGDVEFNESREADHGAGEQIQHRDGYPLEAGEVGEGRPVVPPPAVNFA